MKFQSFIYILVLSFLVLMGCEKDNFDPPTSSLKGKLVYEGQPIGVRSNAVELELWQHGYDFFTKIPVYIAQDGTYSASLFEGDYKLVLRKGNGPWIDNTDSIDVKVKGEMTVDVPVTPYFIMNNASFQRNGDIVTSTLNIDQITQGKTIERISMYVGKSMLLDAIYKDGWADIWANDIGDLNQAKDLNINLSNFNLSGRGYVFARAGIQIAGVPEMIYTEVVKLEL